MAEDLFASGEIDKFFVIDIRNHADFCAGWGRGMRLCVCVYIVCVCVCLWVCVGGGGIAQATLI